MSNFIYDNGDLPGTKVDARPARPPANKQVTAAEFNQLTSALSDTRDALNHASTLFDVARYGAIGDGATDDTAAIQAALDAAGAFAVANAGRRPVVRLNGSYAYSKPLFVPAQTNFGGDGKSASFLLPTNNFYGDNLICAPDASTQGYGPFATGAFTTPGFMAYTTTPTGLNQWAYDLARVPGGRVPTNASWTLSFKFKPSTTPGGIVDIYRIGGGLYANHGQPLFALSWNGLNYVIIFRYDGQFYTASANFSSLPTCIGGTTYHFEVSYDHAAKKLRFFVNGVKWTNGSSGDVSLTSGLSGTSDGSGMYQYPWECNSIGPNQLDSALNADYTNNVQTGTLSEYHIKQGVRHTSSFTPGADSPDGNTWLWLDFTEFYRGCIVGRTMGATAKAYIYPYISNAIEMGGITLKNFYMQRGSGILARFASQMFMEHVIQLYCEDGWQFQRNGYFSHFVNCEIIAGQGRIGFCNQGGSYCTMDYCTWAMNIPVALNSANLAGTGNSLSVQNVYQTALVIRGGGIVDLTLLSIDAEVESTGNWIGAVVIAEPSNSTVTLRTPTLYGPTNKRTSDPVIFVVNSSDAAAPSRIVLENPYFFAPPSAGPVIRNFVPFGAGTTNWAHPIQIINPTLVSAVSSWTDTVDYNGVSYVTDGNVVVTSDVLEFQNARLGTGAPGTGTWRKGNIVWNSNPTSGGNVGWICTTAGSPGTWKAWGTIA